MSGNDVLLHVDLQSKHHYAWPMLFQICSLIGEDLRETFHHRGYKFVRLLYCSTRVIDESGLDCSPARTEIMERALLKQRRRASSGWLPAAD